jgi:tRNA-2-methylthio-N6-dimethylallyladenosine synthase
MSKKLFIETLGCQMNVRDSEHMIAELKNKKGYEQTNKIEEADLIMVNTCSVRDKPVQKLFSEIGHFNKIKKKDAKIGVCGCSATHLGKDIIKRAPYVDFVLGARNISKVSSIIDTKGAVEVDIDHDDSSYMFDDYRSNKYKSFINIMIGCDKSCAYCIVPFTRGDEISIPLDIILNEAKKIINEGVKEICLLGQNVNNYGKKLDKHINFTYLLQKLSEIDGLKRIRFTSPHPLHMDDEFIKEFIKNPIICKSIHMPLQSGSTAILKSMKRGYSKEWFLNRALKIRDLAKDVSITTDVIVGFPGENDDDFADTLDVIDKIRFEQIFNFKYSKRPLTPAMNYDNQIDDNIASSRLTQVIEKHKTYNFDILKDKIGSNYKVLFDDIKPDGYISGKSDNNFTVITKGDKSLLGKIKMVSIKERRKNSLVGDICETK